MSDAVATLIAATEASAASANNEETQVATPTTEVSTDGVQVPAEGQPDTPETPTPAETAAELEAEPNLESTEIEGWDKYKDAFKDKPELAREWRNVLGQRNAYVELGPFSEVREIVQRIPSIEDAQVLTEQAENLKVLSDTLRGSPADFATRLAEIDQNAFVNLVKHINSDEVLQQIAPQVLREKIEYQSNRMIESTWAWAKQHGTAEEQAAVQMFARMRGYRPTTDMTAPAQPTNSELERLKAEKKQREESDVKAAFQNFWDETDSAIINESVGEIQTAIRKAFESQTSMKINDAQLELMTREAWGKVRQAVGNQPQTAAQIARYRDEAMKGKITVAQHKAIRDFLMPRNRRQIPLTVKEVVGRFTKDILAVNSTQIEKKKGVAERTKDVGVGVNGSTSTSAGAPEKPGPKTYKGVWDRLDNEVAAMRRGATR